MGAVDAVAAVVVAAGANVAATDQFGRGHTNWATDGTAAPLGDAPTDASSGVHQCCCRPTHMSCFHHRHRGRWVVVRPGANYCRHDDGDVVAAVAVVDALVCGVALCRHQDAFADAHRTPTTLFRRRAVNRHALRGCGHGWRRGGDAVGEKNKFINN